MCLRKLTAKCFFNLVLFTGCSGIINAQTIFTYGNKPVSKQEFLRAYAKNSTDEKPSPESYANYLELYSRYKLKVQAARDMRLDTLSSQATDLKGFRDQIINSYLNDDASLKVLIDQAAERSRKDIHISHIFIPFAENATPSELAEAKKKIQSAYDALKKGEQFAAVAEKYSMDPAVRVNKGDIGYITTFVLPYDLENVAYNTPVNSFSTPFKSKIGFHILKNDGERPAIGSVQIAQILFTFPPGADESKKSLIRIKADSVYRKITTGADFGKLAAEYSNDNWSFQAKGELPAFGIGRFDPVFETAAFALDSDGAVSKPILTSFGYHILKRIKRIPVPADNSDKNWMTELKQKVESSDRIEWSRKLLVKKVQQQVKYTKLPYNEKQFTAYSDSIIKGGALPKFATLNANTPLFSFEGHPVKVSAWKQFLMESPEVDSRKSVNELYQDFVEMSTMNYYRDHLEKYNKDFASQLAEFKEGNLLFEVMQKKVWDEASKDSVGLEKYYRQHADKYFWEASADAIIFTAPTDSVATEMKKKLEGNISKWQEIVDESQGILQADSGRFELSQIPVVERTNFTPGLYTANVKNENDNSVTFAYIVKLHTEKEPRNFDDARGFVINDYQSFLEEKWIAELKKKYPVVVNKPVLDSLVVK
jgi:peptidyl-prolyl cis-trans isomerase SurA